MNTAMAPLVACCIAHGEQEEAARHQRARDSPKMKTVCKRVTGTMELLRTTAGCRPTVLRRVAPSGFPG